MTARKGRKFEHVSFLKLSEYGRDFYFYNYPELDLNLLYLQTTSEL